MRYWGLMATLKSEARPPNCAAEAQSNAAPAQLLIMESGRGKGGSSTFLYSVLCHLDADQFRARVGFYFRNDASDTELIRSRVPVLFFATQQIGSFLYRFVERDLTSRLLQHAQALLRLSVIELPISWRIYRYLKAEAVDLMLLNNDVHGHVAATLAARLAGIPCLCRKTGNYGEGRRVKKWLAPMVDVFIAISAATERDVYQYCPGARKVLRIYEGVDVTRFQPNGDNRELRAELGIPPGTKVVCSIGRFKKGRGQEELLTAAPEILKAYENVVFLLVGDESPAKGAYSRALEMQVEQARLKDKVIFTGWRSDIPAILAMTDVFVHCPSTVTEGLGIANLEAMASGKPVVVSENGGLLDAVTDGVTGFVVPIGDTQTLAERVVELLRDGSLAARFGAAARKRIEADFDVARNTRKLEEAMQACLLEHAAAVK